MNHVEALARLRAALIKSNYRIRLRVLACCPDRSEQKHGYCRHCHADLTVVEENCQVLEQTEAAGRPPQGGLFDEVAL